MSDIEVASSAKVLGALRERPFLFDEELQGITEAVEQEKQFAYKNEAEHNRIYTQRIKDIKRNIRRGLKIGALAGVILWGGSSCVNWFISYDSPEAIEQRQTDARNKLETMIVQEEKETLDTTPSKISSSNWRIRYAPYDPNVDYVETSIADRKKIQIGGYLQLVGVNSTSISASGYERAVSKEQTLRVTISTKYGSNQNFILRNTTDTSVVDGRVVVFEHTKDDIIDDVRYVAISKMETEDSYIKMINMKKVQADN